MNYFLQNLVYYRNKKGLSKEAAAESLGITVSKLEDFEAGRESPTADEIVAIAQAYSISAKKLFKKRGSLVSYTVKKRKLVGFNRYGMNQGLSVMAVPISAFLALVLMFLPSIAAAKGNASIMEVLFLTNRQSHIIFGSIVFAIMAFNISYWAILLSLGAYTMAKRKVLNNIVLSVFSILTFVICLVFTFLFRSRMQPIAYVCDAMIFVTSLTQVVLLITMNLEGGENSHQQIYTYNETDQTGYDTRHWYTLGMSAFSIISLCLFVVSPYEGPAFIGQVTGSMFELMFGAKWPLCIVFGVFCVAILSFNAIYWVIICTLPRNSRRKTAKANNVLITIMSIILLIDTLAFMSYYQYQLTRSTPWNFVHLTDGGVALYVMLFVTSLYGLSTLPVINSKKKRAYIQTENGIQKIKPIQGQRPGKILAYKMPAMSQIFICVLLGAMLGLSFLDSGLVYVACVSGAAIILELVSIILQFRGRYVSVGVFAYSLVLNTCISVFSVFILTLSAFGTISLGARIALPIVAGFLLLSYASFAFFVKPIRDLAGQL